MATSGENGTIVAQIAPWILREVAHPDYSKQGRCSKVVLRHLSVDRKIQGDVGTFPVRLEEGAEEEIDPLLNAISDAAQNDANDLNSGVQLYALYAYFDKDRSYAPRKVFRVSSIDQEIERDVNPSEPATEKGLVSQTMRHMEAIMRHATVAAGMQQQTMQRELQRLSDQNEKFSQQQVDFMLLLQDTMNDAHSRRLKEKESETSLAMKEAVLSKLEALVPVIINKIAGKSVLPEEDQSFMLMSSLLEGMSEEQQSSFYNSLTDAQRMTLSTILAAYEQKKSKWIEGQKKSVLGRQNALPPPSPGTALATTNPMPVPTTMSIRDRIDSIPTESSDPDLRKLEADAAAFTNRFRAALKSPTT